MNASTVFGVPVRRLVDDGMMDGQMKSTLEQKTWQLWDGSVCLISIFEVIVILLKKISWLPQLLIWVETRIWFAHLSEKNIYNTYLDEWRYALLAGRCETGRPDDATTYRRLWHPQNPLHHRLANPVGWWSDRRWWAQRTWTRKQHIKTNMI